MSLRYSEWGGPDGKVEIGCLPGWMKVVLEMRLKRPSDEDTQARIRWTNKLVDELVRHTDLAHWMEWIGKDQVYFSVSIAGFRSGLEYQELEQPVYFSSTFGRTNPDHPVSPIREFSEKYGILGHEIFARYFTNGN